MYVIGGESQTLEGFGTQSQIMILLVGSLNHPRSVESDSLKVGSPSLFK